MSRISKLQNFHLQKFLTEMASVWKSKHHQISPIWQDVFGLQLSRMSTGSHYTTSPLQKSKRKKLISKCLLTKGENHGAYFHFWPVASAVKSSWSAVKDSCHKHEYGCVCESVLNVSQRAKWTLIIPQIFFARQGAPRNPQLTDFSTLLIDMQRQWCFSIYIFPSENSQTLNLRIWES